MIDRRRARPALTEWHAEHQHLHSFDAMRTALDMHCRERSFEWGPSLSSTSRSRVTHAKSAG